MKFNKSISQDIYIYIKWKRKRWRKRTVFKYKVQKKNTKQEQNKHGPLKK